jgi:hypothetical protein
MSGLIALPGRDVVAAFVAGGFRVARRERGLALLVRGVQVVVVPETVNLTELRIRGLLERAEVAEEDLLSWLVRSGAPVRVSSGFHRKSEPPGAVPAPASTSSGVLARADAAHVASKNALESSHAFQKSLAKWHDGMREVDARDKRPARSRKR